MVVTDTRSVGELERRVERLDATTPAEMDDDDRARLTDALVALADAYGDRGEFDAEADMITRLGRLGRDDPSDDVDVEIHFANALANATAVRGREHLYETVIDPDRLEAYRERIESLYDRRGDTAIAAPLARATAETVHANGRADRRDRIAPLVERLETVYDDHREPDVAAALLRAYAHAERYLGGDSDRDRVARAEALFSDHPDGEVAAGLAGVLAGRTNADAGRTDVDTIEDRIGRIEALGDRYPAREESVLDWLAIATANATRASFEAADPGRVDHWAGVSADLHDRLSTPSTATWCAVATFFSARASFFDGDVEAGEAALDRLEALERRYENPVFAHWLGRAMFDAARCYVETDRPERARAMVDDLAAFAVGHEDREEIEAGLEALRSHAPHLFEEVDVGGADGGDVEGADGGDVGGEEGRAEEPAGGSRAETGGSVAAAETTGPLGDSRAAGVDLNGDASSTVGVDASTPAEHGPVEEEPDADLPGCGSCGEDGCGSCGTRTDLRRPASGPVLAAAGAAVLLVGASVVYTLYLFSRRESRRKRRE